MFNKRTFLIVAAAFLAVLHIGKCQTPSPTLFQCFDGPFVCGVNTDDNPADECLTSTIKTGTEKVECVENFDCCRCDELICNDCREVNCNGDSSCIGTNITIQGDANNGGAKVSCNGDRSCAGTTISGTEITSVECTGDESCVQISTPSGETLQCNECDILCVGDCACDQASLVVDNVGSKVSCTGDNGCQSSNLDLICTTNNGGCEVSCDAESACEEATIIVSNVASFSCGGQNGCRKSIITLNDFNGDGISCNGVDVCEEASITINDLSQNGAFTLECESCQDAVITINIENTSIDSLKEVKCGSTSSCEGLTLVIDASALASTVDLEKIECGGASSCKDATFVFTNVNLLNPIICGGAGACDGVTGP